MRKGGDRGVGDSRADVLLHPVRLRIAQALLSGDPQTVQQLGRKLVDVPQASLYRHLNQLVAAGFVKIVEERPVGGAMERVYSIVMEAVTLTGTDLETATREDHMRYFTTYCVMLMGKFSQYLERDTIDLGVDGVGYRTASLLLTDEEFHQLLTDMGRLIEAVRHNKPAAGRRSRLLATIVMPDDGVLSEDE